MMLNMLKRHHIFAGIIPCVCFFYTSCWLAAVGRGQRGLEETGLKTCCRSPGMKEGGLDQVEVLVAVKNKGEISMFRR